MAERGKALTAGHALLDRLPPVDQRVERPPRGPARGQGLPARRGGGPCPVRAEPTRAPAIARQVRDKGIRDPRVLDALGRRPPRPVPPARDARPAPTTTGPSPIGLDQTISQPFMVAVMTARAGPDRARAGPGDRHRQRLPDGRPGPPGGRGLHRRAASPSSRSGPGASSTASASTNIRYRIGDGTLGWPEEAPFDRILVTAGAPELPRLAVRPARRRRAPGRPDRRRRAQQTHRRPQARRAGPSPATVLPCRFVKLIGEEGWGEDG